MPATPDLAPVSIIMPAYRAETTIAGAVRSVLDQTFAGWELVIVADDGTDYEAVLGRAGIADPRIRHFSSGGTGMGSSATRNVGLDNARFDVAATLDADDALLPLKLEQALPHLKDHGIVSTALRVETMDGRLLRTVGAGPDRVLTPDSYKFVNLSMDSMLVYDRRRADPRYDTSFPCLTDISFLLLLWAGSKTVFHLGTPLHVYSKQPQSVSNGPGAGAAMIATKQRLIALIGSDAYAFAEAGAGTGLLKFYELSLLAEQTYGQRLAAKPGLLFEDQLEPLLAGAGM